MLSQLRAAGSQLFSTALAYRQFDDQAHHPLTFESMIVPFVLNVRTEELRDSYEGVCGLFVKGSKVWRLNPEYITTFHSQSLAQACQTMTDSIEQAIREAVREQSIKTAA